MAPPGLTFCFSELPKRKPTPRLVTSEKVEKGTRPHWFLRPWAWESPVQQRALGFVSHTLAWVAGMGAGLQAPEGKPQEEVLCTEPRPGAVLARVSELITPLQAAGREGVSGAPSAARHRLPPDPLTDPGQVRQPLSAPSSPYPSKSTGMSVVISQASGEAWERPGGRAWIRPRVSGRDCPPPRPRSGRGARGGPAPRA